MFIESFVASLLGGLLGGMATGVTVILVLRAKGQKWFIDPQVDYLEKRLREVVVDQAFGQLGKLFDRGEKIGQIATRVLEVVQLVRGGKLPDLPAMAATPGQVEGLGGPQLAAARAALGVAFGRLGRGREAQHEYEEALRLDPTNTLAAQGLRALVESATAAKGGGAAP